MTVKKIFYPYNSYKLNFNWILILIIFFSIQCFIYFNWSIIISLYVSNELFPNPEMKHLELQMWILIERRVSLKCYKLTDQIVSVENKKKLLQIYEDSLLENESFAFFDFLSFFFRFFLSFFLRLTFVPAVFVFIILLHFNFFVFRIAVRRTVFPFLSSSLSLYE